jgi:hypothetical protein
LHLILEQSDLSVNDPHVLITQSVLSQCRIARPAKERERLGIWSPDLEQIQRKQLLGLAFLDVKACTVR